MLDSKIQHLKDHFGISRPEDWQSVEPVWILSLDGIGPVTLDHVRMYLAARDLTLKNDRTPEYWRQNLSAAKIGHTMGNAELLDDVDRGLICPFTIIVDTAEAHPYTFQGLRSDAADDSRPLIVPTESRSLGRFPDSLGDYSIEAPGIAGVGRCHVERKSMEDAHSTILGWAKKGDDIGRRDRFERELAALSEMEAGLVVVECELQDLIRLAPQHGRRSAAQNAKTLHRSILAWMQDYSVPWLFCGDRRVAEKSTFRWLERWYRKQVEERKAEEKRLAKVNGKTNGQAVSQAASSPAVSAAAIDAQLATL